VPAVLFLPLVLWFAPARAQDFVYPERPGQSNVRWYPEDWRILDVPVAIGDEHATVRLYYYEQERGVTELARASIEESVQRLAKTFDYVPERPIPYVLYSSYQEFLRTNLFPVQEGVLGVTSPKNLSLTLPYFGDRRLFEEVSTHELGHEFTIQKLAHVADVEKASRSAVQALPLWFVEGIAEYYAQGGIDEPGALNPEAAMKVRDLVVNQSPRRGQWLGEFYDEGPRSVLWIYQVGQARCAFLESTYGAGTLQRLLDQSHRLVGTNSHPQPLRSFADLVEIVTGDDKETITAKFAEWIKRRAFDRWLEAGEDRQDLVALKHARGAIQAFAAAPDGSFVAYRAMEPNTGESHLWLADPRASARPTEVVKDGIPGSETLHPVERRNFAIGDGNLAYITESRGRDTIVFETWRRTVHEKKHPPEDKKDLQYRVEFHLHRDRTIDLRDVDLRGAFSPAFEPGDERLAFVGLDEKGQRDLYVIDLHSPKASIVRLTNDEYAEREVSWGPSGIVFTSDRTTDGHYNLFAVDPDQKRITQLTHEARDEEGVLVLRDGRTFFTAYDSDASNLYELLQDGSVVRRTDVATGVTAPAPGPDGRLWTLLRFEGSEQVAQIAVDGDYETIASPSVAAAPPEELPRGSVEGSVPYAPLAARNWRVESAFGLLGIAGNELYGSLYVPASDLLRNHSLVIAVTAWGNIALTEANLLYADQSGRSTWALGAFQTPRYRYDQSLADQNLVITSYERFFGGLVGLRHPLDRFLYAQGDLRVGGTDYFLYGDSADIVAAAGLLDLWGERNVENRFQTEATARLGYDTIRYDPFTGPIAGRSLLLQTTLGAQPFDDVVYGTARIDASQYLPIIGSANLFLRGSAGASLPGDYASWFYLYSFETLRGVPFGNPTFLLGRHFLYGTAELQVPLDPILNFFLASNIEGIAALDAGSVSDKLADVVDHPVLDGVLGANFIFGPLEIKLHFAYPFDLGKAPRPADGWVTNLSFGWLYQ
jgi:hypothetical protein